ncbi:membrane protein insertase YidC [Nocardioides sp. WL0053]|uniref:Membrane protein insertase YidC n=2 Tax=Nocardioides jiangsuensis TaxID=2866161 RepID=A0ABS7RGM0_9ACTN|nr:membrane protein insertase YidC [Nocardioides jiangsuensis]MBY9074181.1 membrane protein insertase YidC [Nocardioides jiangsuensis]
MFDFFGDIGSFIMAPLYWITSVILTGFHSLFGRLFGEESGWAWALSIVGLTLVIRAALIPLFVKQIKSSRNMQLLQPKVKELQKKYGHDRERLSRETMALYKETGTNPFASCLPILLQMPIFLALFRLLDQASKENPKGVLTLEQARQFGESTLFGAHIADTFLSTDDWNVRVLALVLVLAMTATTFLTQRQLMSKNMPADALTGPYAQQQKMLLYVLPLVFAVGGIAFPIGVLIYWTTSNLWTMGQQFYVIRNNPAPGTPAAAAKAERVAHKAARKGKPVQPIETDEAKPETEAPKPAPRQQPKKQTRSQRKSQRPRPQGNPGAASGETDSGAQQDPDVGDNPDDVPGGDPQKPGA